MPILTLFTENVSLIFYERTFQYDQSIKHGEFLFGTDLAEKVERQSKEQKLVSKITTDSFPKGSRPNQTFYNPARSFRAWGGGQKN